MGHALGALRLWAIIILLVVAWFIWQTEQREAEIAKGYEPERYSELLTKFKGEDNQRYSYKGTQFRVIQVFDGTVYVSTKNGATKRFDLGDPEYDDSVKVQ